jgi:hypothetical protein
MLFSRKQLIVFFILSSCLYAQTRIKTLFYYILNFSIDIESQEKKPNLQTILETVIQNNTIPRGIYYLKTAAFKALKFEKI